MTRSQITRTYNKLRTMSEQIVFDAISEYCYRHNTECVTNGPFGTSFSRTSLKRYSGYSYCDGKWHKLLETPKKIDKLIEWYEEKFGPLPQAINKQGTWV